MKKEVLFAIFLGLIVGALLVGGIWTASQALHSSAGSLISAGSSSPSPSPLDRDGQSVPLVIFSPKDLLLSKESKLIVEGKTYPATHVIFQTETDTLYLKSDGQGTFSQEITLSPGSNDLTVTALTDTGDTTSRTVSVVYSTATL